MNVGGIDIGTTGCKIAVYNHFGQQVGSAYRNYPVSRSNSAHEINPEDIWESVQAIIGEVTSSMQIHALGVTSFGESFVLLDEDDRVLFPAMLYTDPRGEEEAKEFPQKLIEETTGLIPDKMFSLPKLMWIKANEPQIFAKTKKVLLIQDFIVYKLCGKAVIDYSLASRTMAFDIHKRAWSDEILKIAGIDRDLFSTPVETGTLAEKSYACQLSGCAIVSGCHDQIASAIGAGITKPGMAADGMGTVECITPIFRGMPEDKSIISDGFSILPFIGENLYACYALLFCCGALTSRFTEEFCGNLSHKELESAVDTTCPGDVLLLPHFAGAASPYMDAHSKGAITNLTLATTKFDIYRAILECTTYEMLVNLKRLEKSGIKIDSLVATGGGANSDTWLQLKSNILGIEIKTVKSDQVGACGTAMLAGVACGMFKNIDEAVKITVKENKVFTPNTAAHKKFVEKFKKYEKMYNAVKPLSTEE